MNVRLQKTYTWLSGLVWDGEYMINSYEIQLRMTTHTADPELPQAELLDLQRDAGRGAAGTSK